MKSTILLAGAGLALCGCASVMDPTASAHQVLQVSSNPQGADCTLTNDKGSWAVHTPGEVTVSKTNWPGLLGNQLEVVCAKGALKGSDSFSSLPRGWGWASAAGGGATAFADRQTGTGYADVIIINLK